MKTLLTLTVLLLPALSLAQPTTDAAGKPGKTSAAPVPAAAKKPIRPSPQLARSAVKAVEEVTPIDDDPNVVLTPEDLEVAKRVHVGTIPCELGATVVITPSRREGFFVVQTKNLRYRMHPVESRTGAIRLEDPRRGAMWLQLGNKSMLMSQKLGARLADECMSPTQVTMAEQLKKNPVRSLLDAPEPSPMPAPIAQAVVPEPAASAAK